jgi:hypothetical protein
MNATHNHLEKTILWQQNQIHNIKLASEGA